jgi:hypothetical protein
MSSGEWWNEGGGDSGIGDYNPAQTAQTQSQLDPNTVYSPPGSAAPVDQYNYVPDPNAPGGYQTFAPGQIAPLEAPTFSNQSGQYPDDASMSNSIANQWNNAATITADGFANMPQQEQDQWKSYYGANLAPYAWGQQSGNYNVPAGAEGFNALPQDQQNTWYGTYGDQAPSVWAQQSAQNLMNQQGQSQLGNIRSQAPPYVNNPASIGAGTQWTAPGWGVPGFGQAAQQITPQNWAVLNNPQLQQQLAPGYIPGSGTYNQFNLSNGNLFGNIAGVMSNLNYGVGGPGDPTKGTEPQTPQQWVQGDRLFNWSGNLGTRHNNGTEGLDYIPTLFGRSDTPSGIGTATWDAPKQYWDGLAQAIGKGIVQPTARGWQALQQKGYTPQGIGGAAPQQAQSVGVGANGAGGAGQGPMGAGTQAFNYQAAYMDYLSARMNALEIPGMKNQNQQFIDQLAFEQAKQKWLEQYQQQTFGEGQRQFNELQGLRQGEMLGQYNGQQTLAAKAQQDQTSLGYLNLLGQLRGPGDIFQYLKVLNGTPGGIRDVVNAASGAYRMPGTGGSNVTVGGANTGGPAGLDSLLSQMNNPNYGQEAQNLNLPLPNQINALALQRMTPSQQQSLLGAYEAAGYNPNDVLAIFRNSMPQYAGASNSGRVNLFR